MTSAIRMLTWILGLSLTLGLVPWCSAFQPDTLGPMCAWGVLLCYPNYLLQMERFLLMDEWINRMWYSCAMGIFQS